MFEHLINAVNCFSSVIACVLSQAANGQTVVISESDLVPTPVPGLMSVPDLHLPDPEPAGPGAAAPKAPEGLDLLMGLIARGQSHGFGGILYENRDRDHSPLPPELFPGLIHLRYDSALRSANWDFGLARRVSVPGPLVGNSSTALTAGAAPRSQTRAAMTSSEGPATAYFQYAANSLYLYPEHRDHDASDLYPANWAYTLNSQGSSGSDQPFIKALLMTLAAFPSDTRAVLEQEGLIAPALQMLMRRNLSGVSSDADYLSGRAHPSAFDATALRPERMIAQAAAMRPDAVPPMVRLSVIEEDFASHAGLARRSEQLFTSPSALARIWRDMSWQREMVVSAAETADPNGRELAFHWVLLRGSPGSVSIEPLDAAGSRARIRMDWHDSFAVPAYPGGTPGRLTSRIDIGVFATNGANLSAPAMISVSFPTHQIRSYGEGPDGRKRLDWVDYDADTRAAAYDPLLFWSAPWRDDFSYGPDGALTGWQRSGGGAVQEFRADGRRADGTPVVYMAVRDREGHVVLNARPGGQ